MPYTICISARLEDDCIEIRQKVFVEEQGFKNEFDDIDSKAYHALISDDESVIATGRLYTNDNFIYHIGRIAVLPAYRGKHIGQMVVSALERKAVQCGGTSISLSAQCRAADFYKKLGYIELDDVHMDEFCPHVTMIKNLK